MSQVTSLLLSAVPGGSVVAPFVDDFVGGIGKLFSGVEFGGNSPMGNLLTSVKTAQAAQLAAFPAGKPSNLSSIPQTQLTASAFGGSGYTQKTTTTPPATGRVTFWDNVKSFFKVNSWWYILLVAIIPAGIILYILYRIFFKRKRR